jgi:hypothetical protein
MVKCWCGDDHEPPACPTCDKCGAPVDTGMMAVFCSKGSDCEFWPEDKEGQEFVMMLRMPAADDEASEIGPEVIIER